MKSWFQQSSEEGMCRHYVDGLFEQELLSGGRVDSNWGVKSGLYTQTFEKRGVLNVGAHNYAHV